MTKKKPTLPERVVHDSINRGPRVSITFPERGRTHQSFAESANINYIVGKFLQSGQLPMGNLQAPEYGYAPSQDFAEALALVSNAELMFDNLPSAVRSRFDNDPQKLLSFIEDPANSDEAISLGLAEPRPKEALTEPLTEPPTVGEEV